MWIRTGTSAFNWSGEGKNHCHSFTIHTAYSKFAHPHVFPTGEFGFKVIRVILLSPSRYFTKRIPNFSQKFAIDSDYIFFIYSVLQKQQLNSQINIPMRTTSSHALIAGLFNIIFKETAKRFVAQYKAYSFMNTAQKNEAFH